MAPETDSFQFQRFFIDDDRCGMKVGTDAILLGAWCDVASCHRLLDIGTGCGIIALMVAQRTEPWTAQIDAIDIEIHAANQATSNVRHSPWPDRINVSNNSLSDFHPRGNGGGYDHCICNPPYFKSSWPSADDRKQTARHVGELTHESLFRNARRLLQPAGKLSLILPFDQIENTVKLANANGFYLSRQTRVAPMPGKPCKRVLFEFSLKISVPVFDELTIEVKRHQYSPEFASMTQAFYLRFASSQS